MNWKKYFTRKSVASLVAEAESDTQLERTLTATQLITLGVGAIIGAGIFVLTGTAASLHAGPAIVISFALSGMACACAGLCYAELASMIPVSGSSYTYAYATLGELAAWFLAACMMLTYFLSSASVASGWSSYVVSFLSDYGIYIPAQLSSTTGDLITMADGSQVTALFDLPAFLIVMLITGVLYTGADTSAFVNAIIVAIKMSVLFAFIVVGLPKINLENWAPFIPANKGTFGEFGISGIISGASMVFLAFSGFDTVATAAQETKNPQRDLPIGILGSIAICTLTYIIVAGILTGLVPYTELNVAQPIGLAVDKIGLPWFATVVKIGAIAGLTSVILVMLYGLSRILFTITHDGLLPQNLSKIHPKFRTPHVITLGIGIITATLSACVPLAKLVQLANFGTLTTFAIVCFGALFLRYSQPELHRSFKCPLMPWIPLFGIALFLQILLGLPLEIHLYAFTWIGLVLVFYFMYGQYNSRLLNQQK